MEPLHEIVEISDDEEDESMDTEDLGGAPEAERQIEHQNEETPKDKKRTDEEVYNNLKTAIANHTCQMHAKDKTIKVLKEKLENQRAVSHMNMEYAENFQKEIETHKKRIMELNSESRAQVRKNKELIDKTTQLQAHLDLAKTRLERSTASQKDAWKEVEKLKTEVDHYKKSNDRYDDVLRENVLAEHVSAARMKDRIDNLRRVKIRITEWRHYRLRSLGVPPRIIASKDILNEEDFKELVESNGGSVDPVKDAMYITRSMMSGIEELPGSVLEILPRVPQ